MRKFFLLAALVPNLAFADSSEVPLDRRLYEYIQSTQIWRANDPRSFGLWQNTIKVEGDTRVFHETDIFTGLHIMLMLDALNKKTPLVGYEEIRGNFNAQFEQYRKDSEKGAGTLNFWPLRQGGFHGFSADPSVAKITGIPDLFNDFDDSALGFLWQMAEGEKSSRHFWKIVPGEGPSEDFINTVAEYNDLKSGAFFTWYTPRLPNTDCVVNLNILHALAKFEASGGELPRATLEARNSSLEYIRKVLGNFQTGTCATYYDRSSQFFIALARVYEAKPDYITDRFFPSASLQLISYACNAIESKKLTEIAEYLVALKLFFKAGERELRVEQLITALSERLKSSAQEESDTAFFPGDSVFMGTSSKGEWAGKTQRWYSPAQSTATALLALNLP